MGHRVLKETIYKRYEIQVTEVVDLRENSVVGEGFDKRYTDYVTCQGTHPSRLSGKKHKKCGKRIRMMYAYKCLYCSFWFCAACAEIHFGKTRKQHNAELAENKDA